MASGCNVWLALVAVGTLLASAIVNVQGTTAQEPAPMTAERTGEVMEAYIAALTGNGPIGDYFAADIVVSFADLGQVVTGKDAVVASFVDFHQIAFDATLEVGAVSIGPGIAFAEVVFTGTHIGVFAGIPATGREVRVPYVAVTELSGDLITAIRLYGPASGLIQQLTAEATPAP